MLLFKNNSNSRDQQIAENTKDIAVLKEIVGQVYMTPLSSGIPDGTIADPDLWTIGLADTDLPSDIELGTSQGYLLTSGDSKLFKLVNVRADAGTGDIVVDLMYLCDIQGKDGRPGRDGQDGQNATSIELGTVTEGDEAEATLTPVGDGVYVLDLVLPRGAQGPAGQDGLDGQDGERGPAGPQGPKGDDAVSLSIGTVTTGLPSDPASANLTSDGDGNYTLSLTIPQGQNGVNGISADITGVTASVDSNTGTPYVNVSIGGTPLARTFNFEFHNLKGETGGGGGGGTTILNNNKQYIASCNNDDIPIDFVKATDFAEIPTFDMPPEPDDTFHIDWYEFFNYNGALYTILWGYWTSESTTPKLVTLRLWDGQSVDSNNIPLIQPVMTDIRNYTDSIVNETFKQLPKLFSITNNFLGTAPLTTPYLLLSFGDLTNHQFVFDGNGGWTAIAHTFTNNYTSTTPNAIWGSWIFYNDITCDLVLNSRTPIPQFYKLSNIQTINNVITFNWYELLNIVNSNDDSVQGYNMIKYNDKLVCCSSIGGGVYDIAQDNFYNLTSGFNAGEVGSSVRWQGRLFNWSNEVFGVIPSLSDTIDLFKFNLNPLCTAANLTNIKANIDDFTNGSIELSYLPIYMNNRQFLLALFEDIAVGGEYYELEWHLLEAKPKDFVVPNG